jgi:hypothetical protein
MESPDASTLHERFGGQIEPGLYQINDTLRFQACSDDVCEPPQGIKFALPVTIEAGIPPAAKKQPPR